MLDTVNKLVKTFSKPTKHSDKCIQTSKHLHKERERQGKDKVISEKKKLINKKLAQTPSELLIYKTMKSQEKAKNKEWLFSKMYKDKTGCGDMKKDNNFIVLQNELLEFNKMLKTSKVKSETFKTENQKKIAEHKSRSENVKRLIKLEHQLDYIWNKLNELAKDNDHEKKRHIELQTKATQYSIPESEEKERPESQSKRNVTKHINMTGTDLVLKVPKSRDSSNIRPEEKFSPVDNDKENYDTKATISRNDIKELEAMLTKSKMELYCTASKKASQKNICKCNLKSTIKFNSCDDIKFFDLKNASTQMSRNASIKKLSRGSKEEKTEIGIQNSIQQHVKLVANKNISTSDNIRKISRSKVLKSAIPKIKITKPSLEINKSIPALLQSEIKNQSANRKCWRYRHKLKTPDSYCPPNPVSPPHVESKSYRKLKEFKEMESEMKKLKVPKPKLKTFNSNLNKKGVRTATPQERRARALERNFPLKSVIFKDFDEFQDKKIGYNKEA